jgi:outer membrane protein assembly factor BamB
LKDPTPSSKRPAAADLPAPEEIARNWPRFRGPRGDGISAYSNVPTAWDALSGQGILWKAPAPLPGNNSPVVWGDHVFLTGASAERHEIYCFDANTGALRWQREVRPTPQGATTPEVSEETGYAAPTSATDGRRVYAMFANGDVAALDFGGNTVWTVGLGTPKNIYGHAASLALCRDLLILQFDQGSAKEGKSQLLALQTATGQSAWKTARDVPNSWSSPIVIGDQDQARIITSASPWVIAYRATDGVELWRSKSLRADVGPSPVYADGVVYVVSEFPSLSAIRTGGKGDITKTHVAWTADAGLSDTCGPLVTDQFVLLLASFGTLTCYDKQVGGEPLWEMDFDDSFSSSPGLVGNRVYLFGEEGKAWVVEVDRDEGKLIAQSDLGQPCVTSPAFQDGRIYIRGKKDLFCLGTKE